VESDTEPRTVSPVRRWVRWILPFVVSIALLSWLFARFDFSAVLSKIDLRVASIMLPTLFAYGAFSLWIEAQSMVRVMASSGASIDAWTCARIKAASYLFAIVNYAIGAGVLAILLKRRTKIRLADTAGAVAVISVLDLVILLFLTAVGLVLVTGQEPALQMGIVLGGVGLVAGGFAVLRAPIALGGPIEKIRNFALFRAIRTTPIPTLVELLGLRFLFVGGFMGVAAAALVAFHVSIPVGDMIVGFTAVALVAALPVAVSGLGTGQETWLAVFGRYINPETGVSYDPATLLASSLVLSFGMIFMRAGVGITFARELTGEAMKAAREVDS